MNEEDESLSVIEEEKFDKKKKNPKKKRDRTPGSRNKDILSSAPSNHNRKEIVLIDQQLNDLLAEKARVKF